MPNHIHIGHHDPYTLPYSHQQSHVARQSKLCVFPFADRIKNIGNFVKLIVPIFPWFLFLTIMYQKSVCISFKTYMYASRFIVLRKIDTFIPQPSVACRSFALGLLSPKSAPCNISAANQHNTHPVIIVNFSFSLVGTVVVSLLPSRSFRYRRCLLKMPNLLFVPISIRPLYAYWSLQLAIFSKNGRGGMKKNIVARLLAD